MWWLIWEFRIIVIESLLRIICSILPSCSYVNYFRNREIMANQQNLQNQQVLRLEATITDETNDHGMNVIRNFTLQNNPHHMSSNISIEMEGTINVYIYIIFIVCIQLREWSTNWGSKLSELRNTGVAPGAGGCIIIVLLAVPNSIEIL